MRSRTKRKLRRLIREEINRQLINEGGRYNHASNMTPVKNIGVNDFKIGDFIRLSYPHKTKGDVERHLLVMNPENDHGNVAFLDLSYLSEKTIAKVFANLHDRMSPMAAQMMNKTFPAEYKAGPIKGGHDEFYYDVVKQIPKARKAYRTYRKERISDGLITRMKYKPSLTGDLRDYKYID